MAYPDLAFKNVIKKRSGAIVVRGLLLLVAVILFTQGVNAYFFSHLSGAERIADILLTFKITIIVALPFIFYAVLLQARADLAVEYFRIQSRTDHLTGLLNRRAFIDALRTVSGSSHRNANDNKALLTIDLDHFKQVNDRYGHDAGDAILMQVAVLFGENLRADDVIARLGGEEFAIALCRGTAGETWAVAQRLRHAVENNVFNYEGQEIRLTISLGLVRYGQGENLDAALRKADLLTYKSKKDGRNRISYAEDQFELPAAA